MVLERSRSETTTSKGPPTTRAEVIEQRLRSEAAAATTANRSKAASTAANKAAPAKERWETAKEQRPRETPALLGRGTHERVIGTEASPDWDLSFDTGTGRPFHRSTPADELERSTEKRDGGEREARIEGRAVRLDISPGRLANRQEAPVASAAAGLAAAGGEAAAQGAITKARAEVQGAGLPPVINTEPAVTVITTTNPFGLTPTLTVTMPGNGLLTEAGLPLGAIGSAVSPIPSIAVGSGGAETFTTYVDASLRPGSIQDSSPVASAIAKGYHVVNLVEAEYGSIDVDQFTADLLQDLCIEANSHKKTLAKVEEKLVGVKMVQRHRDAFAQARGQLIAFIRGAQRRVCALHETSRARSSPPRPPSVIPVPTSQPSQGRGSALSAQLKHDRVVAQEHRLMLEMSGVMAEAQALQKSSPEGDTQIQLALDKGRDLKDRGAELAREALALYSDAVDSEMGESARAIYDCMQSMQSTNRDTMARLSELKAASRVGLNSRSMDADFPPPTFAGGNDEDVYRFIDVFEQYLDAKGLSEVAGLRAMQTVCLKGQVALTCAEMSPLATLKAYLLDVYGQPRALLDAKLRDFAKLGKCPAYPAEKRRDWLIRTQNQLNYLLKICKKFALLDDLMFSPILRQVHDNLTPRVQQEYLETVAEIPGHDRTRKRLFDETIELINRQVAQATADVNTQHILGMCDTDRQFVKKAANHVDINEGDELEDEEVKVLEPAIQPKPRKARSRRKPQRTVHQVELTIEYTDPQVLSCVACPGKHTHMFYCKEFQRAGVDDRIQMAKAQRACRRCLRMDSGLDLTNRAAWFTKHEPNCKTEWTCSYVWTCGKVSTSAQIHMVLCKRHARFNKEKEADFVKSLDQAKIDPSTRFFFTSFSLSPASSPTRAEAMPDRRVIKATSERTIYMMQTVYNDSGCSVAAISQKAAEALHSRNLVPGPTNLNVAGGQVLENQGGVDEFELELFDNEVFSFHLICNMPIFS